MGYAHAAAGQDYGLSSQARLSTLSEGGTALADQTSPAGLTPHHLTVPEGPMLELRAATKAYRTATLAQTALDAVSVSFRDNEFVAVLGQSGSGKTTMLNVIGGLDRFDSGDLVIDGISTRDYKDRDWDAYRNNRIASSSRLTTSFRTRACWPTSSWR